MKEEFADVFFSVSVLLRSVRSEMFIETNQQLFGKLL